MNSDKKIAPEAAVEDVDAASKASLAKEESAVPVFGELITSLQTPSETGGPVEESFLGTDIDLTKSPFPVNNDLFEGLIHILMRDLPGNTYTFDGEKQVLWEIQIQVGLFVYESSEESCQYRTESFSLIHVHCYTYIF